MTACNKRATSSKRHASDVCDLHLRRHARFEVLCDLGTVKLMSNIGLTYAQVQVLGAYLSKHVQKLCIEWGRIHDHG